MPGDKMSAQSYLGITQETIDVAKGRVGLFTGSRDSLMPYIRGTLKRLGREQPNLHQYLYSQKFSVTVFDPFVFGLAAATTYDMVPEYQRNEPLTEETIEAAHQSFHEYTEAEDDGLKLDILWYVDKLESDSPEFADWLADMVARFDDFESQSDFILAAALVSLPFFRRAEADGLRRKFS